MYKHFFTHKQNEILSQKLRKKIQTIAQQQSDERGKWSLEQLAAAFSVSCVCKKGREIKKIWWIFVDSGGSWIVVIAPLKNATSSTKTQFVFYKDRGHVSICAQARPITVIIRLWKIKLFKSCLYSSVTCKPTANRFRCLLIVILLRMSKLSTFPRNAWQALRVTTQK